MSSREILFAIISAEVGFSGLDEIVSSVLKEWFQLLLRGRIGEARVGGRREDDVDMTDAQGSLHNQPETIESDARSPDDATSN